MLSRCSGLLVAGGGGGLVEPAAFCPGPMTGAKPSISGSFPIGAGSGPECCCRGSDSFGLHPSIRRSPAATSQRLRNRGRRARAFPSLMLISGAC